MLQLIDVTKTYQTGGEEVHALRGINLRFRKNEFVSVLGASGCGKTTLLNIIGGLDHYTSGDLVISGKSTKTYTDRDWDVYRNHRIGFVFQSYNLIPQQTVLGNVEIALTIAGVSKAERRLRAEEALKKVGLAAEMTKRPNQLSGGQMQRVAIARALVNNPEILLADEPTGALDSETSVQIMDLIREIAGERLVIMVTHNPELAEEYSSRIVRLHDGLVVADSNPYAGEELGAGEENEAPTYATSENIPAQEIALRAKKTKSKKAKKERTAMSFATSLELSAKNLVMKKGRTTVTSIAGSIGIISVCLVLALSNGFNGYIAKTQEDMLASNPLKITETTLDPTAIITGMASTTEKPDLSQLGDNIYVNSFLSNIAQGLMVTNDISQAYVDYVKEMDGELYEAIAYDTGMKLNDALYTFAQAGTDQTHEEVRSISALKQYYVDKINQIDNTYNKLVPFVEYLGAIYGHIPGTLDMSEENSGAYVKSQYKAVEGRFPENANEAVLVIGGNNDITDLTLAQLGFMKENDFVDLFQKGEEAQGGGMTIPFENVVGKEYYLYYNDYLYTENQDPTAEYKFTKVKGDEKKNVDKAALESDAQAGASEKVTVVGILRLKEGVSSGCLGGGLYFTEELTEKVLAKNYQSKISQHLIKQEELTQEFLQKIQSGSALGVSAFLQNTEKLQTLAVKAEKSFDDTYTQAWSLLPEEYQATVESEMATLKPIFQNMNLILDGSSLRTIGAKNTVNAISIYTSSFDAKDKVVEYLNAWNDTHDKDEQVKFTDTVGTMLAMVEMMLNAITVVLVIFTGISLVVSSVMIGIITYVSVVERVKEIGVLRSLGARKKDIRNLFNAETFIIGLSSGVFGVGVTYLIALGGNAILGALTGISTLIALPITTAAIMIGVSVALTLISGLLPAGAAAKKDPVVALRTE